MLNFAIFLFICLEFATCFCPSIRVERVLFKTQRRAHSAEDDSSSLESLAELDRLQKAALANKDEFEAMLKAKLDEWKTMKAAGILDKLGMDGDFEETIVEMDEMSKRLLRRRRGLGIKDKEGDSVIVEVGGEKLSEKGKIRLELLDKLNVVGHSKTGTALGVQSLLNEMKDKEVEDTDLVEAALMALTKLGSNSITLAAFKQYQKWVIKGSVVINPEFTSRFVNTCYASETLAEAADGVLELVNKGQNSEVIDYLPGLTCRDIYASTKADAPSTSVVITDSKKLDESLRTLYTKMPALTASHINIVLRALGRRRLVSKIFELIEQMKIRGPAPNDETIEFLANSLVATVDEESKARSMKDLPKPVDDLPEIVFAGRSNVGKSSLVNFLVNRKALASTSATPGHTTQFHFFAVNQGRKDLPKFRVVDVPGLGYAEATEGTQDSWRSLLERFMTVRDSLNMVFHLVDSRHKITAVDQQMMEMAARAAAARKAEGRTALRYAVILTKTDRASFKALRDSRAEVKAGTKELAEILGVDAVPIIATSSVAREGRDDLWRLILDTIM